MDLQHLLILCCYGGQPYIDFHQDISHQFTRQMDPTEWMATDTAGILLMQSDNSSNMNDIPRLNEIQLAGTNISNCDLFNVTFMTTSDQQLFKAYKADLSCRCPTGAYGSSCEYLIHSSNTAALKSTVDTLSSQISLQKISMIIVLAAVLLAFFIITFMMVRGCFCDCFGPFSLSYSKAGQEPYDKPLDPRDVEKCLRKYRQYEAEQQMAMDQNRPLVATISSSYNAYNPTTVGPTAPLPPPAANPQYRPPSPPPSYSSIAGSQDRLPTTSI
ncbi:unnamed protein product [Auanema sp. JU1783]|nr:unnamed protein product [Auanema sp. JU1783]